MRIVLDTSTVVAAIRSDAGASRQLMVAGLLRRFEWLVSVPLMFEYEAVLTRAAHLRTSRLSIDDVGAILDAVAKVAEPVHPDFLWRPTLQDAEDDMVLEAAINGRADLLVTFNRRDFAPAVRQFSVVVASPLEALRHLGDD